MFEDVSRLKPRIRRKVSGATLDPSTRPARPSVHGNIPMLWPSGRPLPRSAARSRPVWMALRRGFDVTITLMALVALSVPFAILFVALRRQLTAIPTRGRNGRLFGRLNFAVDGPKGCLLRETGLDRLPELINVLRGDMSLIESRPSEGATAGPTRSESVSLLADLRILVWILLGRQG